MRMEAWGKDSYMLAPQLWHSSVAFPTMDLIPVYRAIVCLSGCHQEKRGYLCNKTNHFIQSVCFKNKLILLTSECVSVILCLLSDLQIITYM